MVVFSMCFGVFGYVCVGTEQVKVLILLHFLHPVDKLSSLIHFNRTSCFCWVKIRATLFHLKCPVSSIYCTTFTSYWESLRVPYIGIEIVLTSLMRWLVVIRMTAVEAEGNEWVDMNGWFGATGGGFWSCVCVCVCWGDTHPSSVVPCLISH